MNAQADGLARKITLRRKSQSELKLASPRARAHGQTWKFAASAPT